MGKYRDKSMAYGIVEYRHMFGSPAKIQKREFLGKMRFCGMGRNRNDRGNSF